MNLYKCSELTNLQFYLIVVRTKQQWNRFAFANPNYSRKFILQYLRDKNIVPTKFTCKSYLKFELSLRQNQYGKINQ